MRADRAIFVTPVPRASGLSRQHHGRRVVAVRPSGRRPQTGGLGRTPPNRPTASAQASDGEPGTHRSPGVSSPVGPVRRCAGDRASLPSPNPSANSVGGCRGRNGEPPLVATPHAVLHARPRTVPPRSSGRSARPPRRPAPLRPADRCHRRADLHRPAGHRRRRPGRRDRPRRRPPSSSPRPATSSRSSPSSSTRPRSSSSSSRPPSASAEQAAADAQRAARRPRRPDPPAGPLRLHQRRLSPSSTCCSPATPPRSSCHQMGTLDAIAGHTNDRRHRGRRRRRRRRDGAGRRRAGEAEAQQAVDDIAAQQAATPWGAWMHGAW